ncbi:hypothetical protein [Flavivirga jejuensis]|uniref:Uncharacterized protein n=1 Tax=Flavivirga jejuensis TaxID=870487 RepID=A0ABT8WJD9_9FLAO|nr:hypothetical protein [Flavivirga jejuensis]MDO5973275.1 hypothetical protein [Flavivirga jejuensis]
MKLKRYFYDSSVNFTNISTERLVLSITIGLASAFTIYGFFYVIRESFRLMSFGFGNLPNIISDNNRNLYNIFFAGLSVIFANSLIINLLLSKSQNVLSRFNPKRKRILNEQIFLNFNFSYWFVKIGLVFGMFSMGFMDFDFSEYIWALYLLLFVLYLESWKSLSMVFTKNRFKFQLIHLLILVLLTLGLSRLNFTDYKEIDEFSIKSNPIYDLPHSDFYNDNNTRFYNELSIKINLDDDNQLKFLVYDKWAFLEDVPSIIYAKRASMREELVPFLKVRIIANRDIDLKYIKILEAELYSINQERIIYDVYNDDLLTARFENRGIEHRISSFVLDFKQDTNISSFPLPPLPPFEENKVFEKTLKIEISDTIKINGITVPKDMLVRKFKNYINENVAFKYLYDEDADYQNYIMVLSSHYTAAHKLREQNQTIFEDYFNKNEQYKKEQRHLKKRFPINIIEERN